ncbi:MAG: hypothetical protein AAB328_02595, partial [candidate division NC10 bacterium]
TQMIVGVPKEIKPGEDRVLGFIASSGDRDLLTVETSRGATQTISTAKYEVTVPKAWGKYVSYSNNNLLLEAPDGMRIVDVEGKAPEYPKVKVFIRWQ